MAVRTVALHKCASPRCGKKTTRPRFCSNRCKDKYHNWTNPRGKFAHLKDASSRITDVDQDYEFNECASTFDNCTSIQNDD